MIVGRTPPLVGGVRPRFGLLKRCLPGILRVGGAFARSDQCRTVHVLWINRAFSVAATRRRGCFSRHAEGVAHNFFHNLCTAAELRLLLSLHWLSTGCPQCLDPCEHPSTGCPPVVHRTIHTLVCLLRTGPSSVATRARPSHSVAARNCRCLAVQLGDSRTGFRLFAGVIQQWRSWTTGAWRSPHSSVSRRRTSPRSSPFWAACCCRRTRSRTSSRRSRRTTSTALRTRRSTTASSTCTAAANRPTRSPSRPSSNAAANCCAWAARRTCTR